MNALNQNIGRSVAFPFYIFLTLLLGYLGGAEVWSLWLEDKSGLALFVFVLFLAYIGLYWSNFSRTNISAGWWFFYYPVQTALMVGIVILLNGHSTSGLSFLFSATICIVGEALGVWGNSRRAFLLGIFYIGLLTSLLFAFAEREQVYDALADMFVNGGVIFLFMVMFNQQITERQKAIELAESLESANAKLAAYNAKIESLTLQTERQRMARELHDTLAQGVAGLVLQLEAIKNHLKAERGERALAIVEQSLVRARSTLAESRAAIDDLRAESVLNLSESVRERVERFTQATGIPCELDLNVGEQVVSSEVSEHALRVLSEALANVARHAQATQATVKFILHQQQLELEVRDNGKGFDVASETNTGHYGLLGMRERARLTGGTLTVESKAQSGTEVRFVVPSERVGVVR